ncbi:ATP-binding protein [Streptomyces sp. AK04-3B]|uniref:ATP-binding protein n=1 Tax=Streptomyces sp. AK04-3B TaxID=3028650 RepID=UPI0029B162F4|nr:ATP-binding protein [Streptomyces sp. AK04-3B]MDX3803365.1 ATP-binding protein [Streptomyces sp. AK04-3B]
MIISGPATTGKTTTMMSLGRSFQLADARQHPGQDGRRPVLFISLPPAATPKMLVSEFARFLGMPVTDRLNQTQITGAVRNLLCELGTQLVLVDDVHLLDTQRRASAETSDQLKYLGDRIPAPFVYSAIDIETSSLLGGVGRPLQDLPPPPAGLRHRAGPGSVERPRAGHGRPAAAARAPDRNPGQARRLPPRPHRRADRQPLPPIREAALIAITEGAERITKQLFAELELDAAAEIQARPARPARQKR